MSKRIPCTMGLKGEYLNDQRLAGWYIDETMGGWQQYVIWGGKSYRLNRSWGERTQAAAIRNSKVALRKLLAGGKVWCNNDVLLDGAKNERIT